MGRNKIVVALSLVLVCMMTVVPGTAVERHVRV